MRLLSPVLMVSDSGLSVYIQCPGCRILHPIAIDPKAHPLGQKWSWNGDAKAPTFSPSLLCSDHYPAARCHSFIRNGRIEFLNDCFHELRGTTVPLARIPDFWIEED